MLCVTIVQNTYVVFLGLFFEKVCIQYSILFSSYLVHWKLKTFPAYRNQHLDFVGENWWLIWHINISYMIVRLQFKDGSIRRRERNRPDRWALGQAQGKNRSRKKVAVVDNESSDIEKSFFTGFKFNAKICWFNDNSDWIKGWQKYWIRAVL